MACLQLIRPANIITALADIFAGFAASSFLISNTTQHFAEPLLLLTSLAWLLLATIGLYGGGIVFNDVFDAKLDLKQRPERPIPKGIISKNEAAMLGIGFFIMGITAAYQVSLLSFILAATICLLCFSYNAYTKHHLWLGPINMGLCRSGNLLLGATAVNEAFSTLWVIACIPFIFIIAVTTISKNEVYGGNRSSLWFAVILYITTISISLAFIKMKDLNLQSAIPFLMIFAYQVFLPLGKAIRNPSAIFVQQAVKAGVISIIILDAALTASFTNFLYGALVMGLLPISILLARNFSVT